MNNAEKQINEIISKAKAELDELQSELEELETVDVKAAIETGDKTAYKKATDHNIYVTSRRTYIENRIEQLKNGRICDSETIQRLRDEIIQEQRAIISETEKQTREKLDEVKAALISADNRINYGNALLLKIHQEIDRPKSRTMSGNLVPASFIAPYRGEYGNIFPEIADISRSRPIPLKLSRFI